MVPLLEDRARVAAHLLAAESFAHSRDLSALTPAQKLVRELLLNELSGYRARGRYPEQGHSEALTPVFIDDAGTRCAMGHLMELGGEHALVERIANERNFARVKDLADEPRVLAWLEAAGLTVEEAATIQPSYGCTGPAECICAASNDFAGSPHSPPVQGVMTGTRESESSVRIEQLFGDTLGLQVGDLVEATGYLGEDGARVMLVVTPSSVSVAEDGGHSFSDALRLNEGQWVCSSMSSRSELGVTPEVYAWALAAPNTEQCQARLVESNQKFAEDPCLFYCGCSPGTEPTSLSVLFAIAGAMLARRLRAAKKR